MKAMVDSAPVAGPTAARHPRVRPFAVGLALSALFLTAFLLAALFYAVLPEAAGTRAVFNEFLPGVDELSIGYLVLGAAVAVACAWCIALVMVPLYNCFVARD